MAFPFYSNPYQQYYPASYQPVQPPQQPSQPQISQSGIIWVNGAQEAAMFPIAPNNAAALWDKGGGVIYLKQADATGKPSMTVYDLIERKDASAEKETVAEEYAKKSDLAAVSGAVKSFDSILASIKADIDSLKSDMYGIAGKKKAPKKSEIVEVMEDE